MVAMYYQGEDEYGQNPKTLCDWVRNFRLKKLQMKRKLRSGGNLRVCAILSTALMNAELELRRKQQERFQRWLEFQTKINKSAINNHHSKEKAESVVIIDDNNDKCRRQREEITNLWKCELSELDNFMRSISSSSSNKTNAYVNACGADVSGDPTQKTESGIENSKRHVHPSTVRVQS
ncbi:uncharacterized protein LOC119637744 [Glossina fuscipes]|uniref:Uncharacterized protein LOC119637744 n=1 Tax=Glossina fuscipes TaxID=7396 RepID=A0A9C5Z0X5_9MUSC|nr:uncharacterized protein LOC119637744 [Glossina fuscipes]XP_037889893.1 uncharacterized protein LOC119637744 [Glossina fuscipes]XP_037889894.1 uncharacterized protein LOC119637744 [Glossina fuscipes]XP_037889895.1 uncharacterized protein LOC119637744 [Glossina fuscipes]XP_037889896.1 uncharacterized protein LOC119637744 [Glossina fuscipes]XP_037889898.1 uncharacterized protein LOC119637744 [Glossina fuscipes]XP_037889899.1 uncharacterized protein LOC119637744 [Glossina fuscipes]